jgi:hypothetical protein
VWGRTLASFPAFPISLFFTRLALYFSFSATQNFISFLSAHGYFSASPLLNYATRTFLPIRKRLPEICWRYLHEQ